MKVVVEVFAIAAHAAIEFGFPRMAERRVTHVMSQRQRFSQIFVQAQNAGRGPCDLRNLNRMRQAVPKMIRKSWSENLRLVFETPERAGMDHPIAVPLELVAIRVGELRIPASARTFYPEAKMSERPGLHLLGLHLLTVVGVNVTERLDGRTAD